MAARRRRRRKSFNPGMFTGGLVGGLLLDAAMHGGIEGVVGAVGAGAILALNGDRVLTFAKGVAEAIPLPASQRRDPGDGSRNAWQRMWNLPARTANTERRLEEADDDLRDTRDIDDTEEWYEEDADGEDELEDPGQEEEELGIWAEDMAYALDLAENFMPDVDMVLNEGIFCCAMKGSGKSGVCARVAEQIGRFETAMVIFDKEGDLLSLADVLPNGAVVDHDHWHTAEQILTERLQVIIDLESFGTDDKRAAMMVNLVRTLFKIVDEQESEERDPCPIFLDEAQYWLPEEKSVDYLSGESRQALASTFGSLVQLGRKRGLTPFIFTQRIAETRKSVCSLGIQIFMRQVLDNDQKRAMEYIRSEMVASDKKNLAALAPGQGIVCLPEGVQLYVAFKPRRSKHTSITPSVKRRQERTRAEKITRIDPGTRRQVEMLPPMEDLQPAPRASRPVPASVPSDARPAPAPEPPLARELEVVLTAWQRGYESDRKIAAVLGITKYEANQRLKRLSELELIERKKSAVD